MLPHTPSWQITAVVLLVIGLLLGTTKAEGLGAAAVVAGLAGIAATVARSVRHALDSDIRGMAPRPGRSRRRCPSCSPAA